MRVDRLVTTHQFGEFVTTGTIITKDGVTRYHVRCVCGTEMYAIKYELTSGKRKHCGCKTNANLAKGAVKDISDNSYGFLKVNEYNFETKKWKCICACGKTHEVPYRSLISGASKSCGCKRSTFYTLRKGHERLKKHYLYVTHQTMMQRCYNENSKGYKNYGARGIDVHELFHDFRTFIYWIEENLGPKPTPKHSLNRIDNDFGYSPGNLEWATPTEQANNRRSSISFILNGTKFSIPQLIEKFNGSYSFWHGELVGKNKTVTEVLSDPKHKHLKCKNTQYIV